MRVEVIKQKQRKYHEYAKRTHCATYAKTNEEVEVKFSFKRDGERCGRCKECMHNLCLWKEENKEKESECKKKHYEQHKEKNGRAK